MIETHNISLKMLNFEICKKMGQVKYKKCGIKYSITINNVLYVAFLNVYITL